MNNMDEIIKHINDTNASYRTLNSGNAKNTDLFLDNEHYELFKDCGETITVRFDKDNLTKAMLFIASTLPRKFDCSNEHRKVSFSTDFVMEQMAILDAFFTVDGKKVTTKTQQWNIRKDVIKQNGEQDRRFYMNGLITPLEYRYNGQILKSKFTVRNYLNGGYSDLHIKKAGLFDIFDIQIENDPNNHYENKDEKDWEEFKDSIEPKYDASLSLQQIYYGAPGTGKSNAIKRHTANQITFRTTFHPDTDYASFVGAYKPVMKEVDMKVVPVVLNNGASFNQNEGSFKEKRISYEFVMQPFLQAYVAAWKEQANEHPKPVYLIIEEINRGNCAQIFGDIFQLLDRDEEGFSEYPIRADEDLKGQLALQFAELDIQNEAVKAGEVLLLPSNLYIWATMNTSDQSLFPIDSAFKRRWDWKYVPISDAQKEWAIEVGENCYDWWEFLNAINTHIYDLTNSEDKKLGYFFCKADREGYISADKFVSKVIFYLWNDVFKDYGMEGSIFDDEDGEKLTFDKFYTVTDGEVKVNTDDVEKFLRNLGLEPIEEKVSE
jgi:hypothetical protein